MFKAYNIPVPGAAICNSADDAAAAADKIGYPVVMKIVSPDIAHKTDVGGVVVGVKNAQAAKDAYNSIMKSVSEKAPKAKIVGVSIEQMLEGPEVILSMMRDAQFGPVVSFGLGGIYVEILREISQKHIPMTEEELNDMIGSTKAYKLLAGARGLPKRDIDAIKDIIRKIVLITNENPEITELEINPVIAGKEGQGCWAVDCLCVLKN